MRRWDEASGIEVGDLFAPAFATDFVECRFEAAGYELFVEAWGRWWVIESLELWSSMPANSRIAGYPTAQQREMVALGLESLANFCKRQIGHTFRKVHSSTSETIHDGTGAVYSPKSLGPQHQAQCATQRDTQCLCATAALQVIYDGSASLIRPCPSQNRRLSRPQSHASITAGRSGAFTLPSHVASRIAAAVGSSSPRTRISAATTSGT